MENVRKEFEEWATSFGWNVERRDVGDYQTTSTDIAWGGWKGCAEQIARNAAHEFVPARSVGLNQDWTVCAKCGIVKPKSGGNFVCKGRIKVALRDDEFNPDGSFRRVSIIEEARIEAALTPHRRGQLYGLLADEIERLTKALAIAKDDRNTYDSAHKQEAANVLRLTAERDDLRKQWQAEQHVVEVLRRENEMLQVDAGRYHTVERLSWAELEAIKRDAATLIRYGGTPFRVAIDAAMKAGEA